MGKMSFFAAAASVFGFFKHFQLIQAFYWLPAGQKPVYNRAMFPLLLLLKMVLPS